MPFMKKPKKGDGNKPKKDKPKRKSRSELRKWIDKLDKLMSLYVRMRDSKEYHYKYFRCISCQRLLPIDQADCGHFIGRGHMALRFDTRNINAECRACNRFSSDHLVGYRRNLVMKLGKKSFLDKHPNSVLGSVEAIREMKRLGEQQVQLLELQRNETKKWSVWELTELFKFYSALILKMREEM